MGGHIAFYVNARLCNTLFEDTKELVEKSAIRNQDGSVRVERYGSGEAPFALLCINDEEWQQTLRETVRYLTHDIGADGMYLDQLAMAESTFPDGCRMVDNPGLIFFYAAQFMQDCVYYSPELDAWAIAELEDGELTLHSVFTGRDNSLDAVIAAFGNTVRHVVLGFSPADTTGFTCRECKEEDSTFFTRGPAFDRFAENRLRIPTLSHA
jgi:hypothetical protein